MKPVDGPFISNASIGVTHGWRTPVKRAVMFLHGYGLPASAVTWLFRVLRLRNA